VIFIVAFTLVATTSPADPGHMIDADCMIGPDCMISAPRMIGPDCMISAPRMIDAARMIGGRVPVRTG
jgi:UDP-3-O-[3-hydroxymyristoyl] glucosamine N-acyltransferase